MYRIGQYRYNPDQNYLNTISGFEENYQAAQTSITTELAFRNKCININSDSSIISTKNYYLCFKIKKRKPRDIEIALNESSNAITIFDNGIQSFVLKLKNQTQSGVSNNNEQIIGKYNISAASNSNNEEFEIFEVVFSSNTTYNQIVWELQRNMLDYQIQEKTDDNSENVSGRVAKIVIIEFAEINNIIDIIPKDDIDYLTKIGIQGPPSLLMCINGQQIRLGRNGIYEINNGIHINFIGFIPHENDYFLMDYEY